MYISFEGIDTAGKNTQVNLLQNNLESLNNIENLNNQKNLNDIKNLNSSNNLKFQHIQIIEEPYSSKISYDFISGFKDRISSFLAFNLARSEIFKNEALRNSMQSSKDMVIASRSFVSALAYSLSVNHTNKEFEKALDICLFATRGLSPSKIILLHIDKNELSKRLSNKLLDRFELMGLESLLKVQENYKRILKSLKKALDMDYLILEASLEPLEINKMVLEYIRG